ncbi:MAG TPA: ankyrin repeat domain-containing protein [Bryobacteraceae bacterium]|nr:ankyrin repeat domain-containing protein [Bryobacteraceae bacterium]
MLAWLITAIASLLIATAFLWGRHECHLKQEAGRIVKAIEAEDENELSALLLAGTDVDLVRDWFGETALILAVKSCVMESGGFARDAVSLFVSHGADINEPGTLWKTALMHAAANGNWHLCMTLLAYGADAAARDMFGRTAADWAQHEGYNRIASRLRKVGA